MSMEVDKLLKVIQDEEGDFGARKQQALKELVCLDPPCLFRKLIETFSVLQTRRISLSFN
jgi:hypothetical protein